MAPPLRIESLGALYHVTARGNAREDIFVDDADRVTFLEVCAHVSQRFNWCCYAYCLMSNRYHCVIETPDANLFKGMRQLNGVYTQRFNRTHGRIGHVFQGRYTAILVERDAYLLELCSYVVLNPVRAGMVRSAREWPWSSYRATGGGAGKVSWLTPDWVLGYFGRTRRETEEANRDFVSEGREQPSIWEHLKHQLYLSSEPFISRVKKRIPARADLSEIPRAHRRLPPKLLKAYVPGRGDLKASMIRAYASWGV